MTPQVKLPAGYTLRTALPDDAETIQAQRDAMFADMGKEVHKVEAVSATALGWHRRMLQVGLYEGVLMHAGADIVAGAGLLWRDWPPNPDTAEQTRAYLLNVYVQPQHRGQGLAWVLVQTLLTRCASRGVNIVSLHASEAGRPIYEGLGFRASSEMELLLPEGIC
ncbi:N-acetyltransferase Eis [Deinococcus carri]|uniref:N-acetyltransferase Eis n=1 Tax=Deinococcus carri TaxID=1211323 RepID=A0ABP9W746_9DEIO